MAELREAIQAKKAKIEKMVHQFEDLHIPEGIIFIDSMIFIVSNEISMNLVKMNATQIIGVQKVLSE